MKQFVLYTGKTLCMLYSCYKGFLCRVRIYDRYSDWYEMTCGIHQGGGGLSLIKYIAFINSFLVELKEAKICCNTVYLQDPPLGYTDDIVAASVSKNMVDQVLNIVHDHRSKTAKKSAVVAYGETTHENKHNILHRSYILGKEKISGKNSYDHVGVKTFNGGVYNKRTQDKISKARKALSVASALGIKKGGLSIVLYV